MNNLWMITAVLVYQTTRTHAQIGCDDIFCIALWEPYCCDGELFSNQCWAECDGRFQVETDCVQTEECPVEDEGTDDLIEVVDQGNPSDSPNCQCLFECEGDCDGDNDCVGDLECWHRANWDDDVPPGCKGDAHFKSHDYCYDPTTTDPTADPTMDPTTDPTDSLPCVCAAVWDPVCCDGEIFSNAGCAQCFGGFQADTDCTDTSECESLSDSHYVAHGRTSWGGWGDAPDYYCQSDDDDQAAYESSFHDYDIGVGCCSMDGTTGYRPDCDAHPSTYQDADDLCTVNGYRLCTLNEMMSGITEGKGCLYDAAYQWVSDSCSTDVDGDTLPVAEQWTIELSAKDLLIWALVALNVLTITALCIACARSMMGRKHLKYQMVEIRGDSEVEQFQQ